MMPPEITERENYSIAGRKSRLKLPNGKNCWENAIFRWENYRAVKIMRSDSRQLALMSCHVKKDKDNVKPSVAT
jgi:hypothetical protein